MPFQGSVRRGLNQVSGGVPWIGLSGLLLRLATRCQAKGRS